ncbi:MAG: PIN domain-containing protein [Planctomycetes bacterium]|nr:PIN domain-containing protein [Planctomycetota bacterium]
MRVYVDTCCFSVVTKSLDVPQNAKALSELRMLLFMIENGHLSYVHSGWLDHEIGNTKPPSIRRKIRAMLPRKWFANVPYSAELGKAGDELAARCSMGVEDAYHVASALAAEVDILISFDKDFVEKARQNAKLLHPMRVLWLPEWFGEVYEAQK